MAVPVPPSRLAALALAALATGCARNAVLEIELTVPAQPATGPARYAVLQFEAAPQSFETDWRGANDYPGVALDGEPQMLAYSVVSEDESTIVQMKVLFCTTPDCSALDDAPDRVPSVWYRLERSLYIGERTRWEVIVAAVPADPASDAIEVGKCEIEGCIRATGSETSFCRLSGEHYCE